MARVALRDLQIAVIELQLVGRAGMTQGVKNYLGQASGLPQLIKLLRD